MKPLPPPALITNTLIAAACLGLLSGCGATSGMQVAGTAIGLVLEASGVIKKDGGDPSKKLTDLNMRIHAGEQLNTASNGKPLSLVLKLYNLRAPERLKSLTYGQASTPDYEKEAFGEELISSREIVLLPGKVYDIVLKVPGDATTIGVVGLFRAPFSNRWKLGFDAKSAFDTGITLGAHACALTTSKGALIPDTSPDTPQSLVGVKCNQPG